MGNSYHQIREEYLFAKLDEDSVNPDPFLQFEKWMSEAIKADLPHPTSMLLATCGTDGQPSCRVVLLKHSDEKGFQFFTNYESKKGRQLSENHKAALTFFWMNLERQVRIEGITEKLPAEISDDYFDSRPFESRLSAVVSPQSSLISGRDELETLKNQLRQKITDQIILRPSNWGGYVLKPSFFEFWQGRESRLHDRIIFVFEEMSGWVIKRLAP